MGTRTKYIKTKYPGTYVKTDPLTKVKTYLARVKVAGFETDQIVGYSNDKYKTNPSLAYERRTELVNKIKAGHSIKFTDNPTLEAYYDDFIENRKSSISKSWYSTCNLFFKKHIPQNIKSKRLQDIKIDDLQKIISNMLKNGYSPRYTETVKELLGPLYKKAMKEDIVTKNIILYLEFKKYDNTKDFYLPEAKSKELYQAILNIADNQYRLMFLFLLRGRRKGEVLSLCWEDVDFEQKIYTLRDENNKIRENIKIILDDELIEHFNFIDHAKKGLIFKSYRTGRKMSDFPRKLWAKIIEKLEIQMTFHDFRHLLGGTLVNNDVSLEVISAVLTHKSTKTTQRYSRMKENMAKAGSDIFLDILKK